MLKAYSLKRTSFAAFVGVALFCVLHLVRLTSAQDDAKAPEAEAPAAAEAAASTEASPPAEGATGETAAPPAAPPRTPDQIALDTVWTMMAGFLVMWMQAGFALVETGLTRAKNAVNICMKNLLDYCFGSVAFWICGFGFMFGPDGAAGGNDFVGTEGWFLSSSASYPGLSWTSVPLECKFFFQLVFAATSATIVSGAMAERTKFSSYMAYSAIISAFIYPISGHWIWGAGWLADMGFWDFAGSTVVHSLGGWLSLAGAFILGPRLGKYDKDGKARAIPGHNLVLLTLGVFILYLGWFGFNPGSTMGASDPALIARITIVTNIAGAVGGLTALFTAKALFKKWEATMALNGVLAGLVAVTAPCAWISMGSGLIVGAVAGVLVVFSVLFFEHVAKIDDPVGAISVHGVCGSFGTLCVGLFADKAIHNTADPALAPKNGLFFGGGIEQLGIQATGVGAVLAWGLVTGAICFLLLKYTIGLRVTPEEEREGLDFGEHGNEAYHGFQFIDEAM